MASKKLDIEKTYGKFRDITDSVERLKVFRDVPLEEFLKDRDKQDIASFRLIVATEAAFGICLHTASRLFKKAPEHYAGCFELLAENNLIDRDLPTRLGELVVWHPRCWAVIKI